MSTKSDSAYYIDQRGLPVHIAFIPSEKALLKECRRLKMQPFDFPIQCGVEGHVRVIENASTGAIGIFVFVRKDKDKRRVISTIIHESVHVWQMTCEHIGEESPGMEMEAYSIQSISDSLIEAYEKCFHGGKKWL